jgi:hypothetical protein
MIGKKNKLFNLLIVKRINFQSKREESFHFDFHKDNSKLILGLFFRKFPGFFQLFHVFIYCGRCMYSTDFDSKKRVGKPNKF